MEIDFCHWRGNPGDAFDGSVARAIALCPPPFPKTFIARSAQQEQDMTPTQRTNQRQYGANTAGITRIWPVRDDRHTNQYSVCRSGKIYEKKCMPRNQRQSRGVSRGSRGGHVVA
jgi:hypothetical protein